MKWKSESSETHWKRASDWHKHFCWFPVQIGEQKFWLETVERKVLKVYPGWTECDYREIEK